MTGDGLFPNAVYPLVIMYPYKFTDDVPMTQQAQVFLAPLPWCTRVNVLMSYY